MLIPKSYRQSDSKLCNYITYNYIKGQTSQKDDISVSFKGHKNGGITFYVNHRYIELDKKCKLDYSDVTDMTKDLKSLSEDKHYSVMIDNTPLHLHFCFGALLFLNSNGDGTNTAIIDLQFANKYYPETHLYIQNLLSLCNIEYKGISTKKDIDIENIVNKLNEKCEYIGNKIIDEIKQDVDSFINKVLSMNIKDELDHYNDTELFEAKEPLEEAMHKYVYGQGYTIREKKSNPYDEHNMLKVKKDGSTNFVKYYGRSAGTPWARFLNKRDAELYMLKNNLQSKDYEVVKGRHPKYMELVNEETGLYKVVSEDDYNLRTFGKDKVKYFDTTGTEQSTPAVPLTVKKSNKSVAWYVLKNAVSYWGNLIEKSPVKYREDNFSLDITFMERSSYNVKGIPDTFRILIDSELYNGDDMSPVIDLIVELGSDDTEVTRGFRTARSTWDKKLAWRTYFELPFKDILTFPRLDIDYDSLTKLSDEQIFNLKQFINENRDMLFNSIIKSKLDKVINELKEHVYSQLSKIKEYYNTEVFENLSLKELFEKAYYE